MENHEEKSILIRAAAASDAEQLVEIYAPYVRNTAITFEYEVPGTDEFRRRIVSTLEKYPYILAEYDGKILGYAYVGEFHARPAYDWAVETSIYVAENCRRIGVGMALYKALEQILSAMGILNMEACIACTDQPDEHLDNTSINFHTGLGYRMVGEFIQCGYKFNHWYNMVWMEKHIGVHKDLQQPVKKFNQVEKQLLPMKIRINRKA